MDSLSPSPGQVLGKRKHGSQPIMRVSNQFRSNRGSSSQVFPQNPSGNQVSIDDSNIAYQNSQPMPSRGPRRTSKQNQGSHTFVTNTVDTMKNGQRRTVKRTTSNSTPSEVSSVNSSTAKTSEKRLRLRPSKPVQIASQIYQDVWMGILSFAEPKFVLEARTINKRMKELLEKYSTIWKECRMNHYGADMPPCPTGLIESKYVDLLAGRGCQVSKCSKTETQKVHWLFQGRLCTDCLAEKTIRVDELPTARQNTLPATGYEMGSVNGLALWELLPLARLDGRDMHIIKVDTNTNTWARNQGNARHFRFLKSDYIKLENEYLELVNNNASDQELRQWTDKKHKKTMELVTEAIKLESWCKQNIHEKQTTEAQDLRQTRARFFEARALELSPPMSAETLWKMADFKSILKVRSVPTQRSWDMLKSKIEPYRSHATQVLNFEEQMKSPLNPAQFEVFKKLHNHRKARKSTPPSYQPEQKFVLRLAEKVFARIKNEAADEDLLLLCLKNIFDKYSALKELPTGLNFDGTTGPYRLSLDDARMIIEDVMEEQIPRNTPRGRIVFKSLRCRGCHRNDHVRTYSFEAAFEHILEKHAMEVGEGLEYYQFAQSYPKVYNPWTYAAEGCVEFKFPWYTMFWPRCLPLVPKHQDPSKMKDWHPAVPTEYVQVEKRSNLSAFDGRQPCDTGHPDDDFAANLVFAMQKLYDLWLDSPCQLRIALKFAVDLYARKYAAPPSVSKFTACLDQIRTANPKIDLKFGCGLCVAEGKEHKSSRQNKYRKYVDQLERHWAQKHHGGPVSWTEGMMQLPSESEVGQQIAASDRKLRAEQEAVKERQLALHKDMKKRANAKASVILQQRAAGEVFDELFTRV